MDGAFEADLLDRYDENPIIASADIPFTCNTVFNASPVKIGDEYLVLLRVEGQHGYSVFALGRGRDGYNFQVESLPVMTPATEGPMAKYEPAGIEDPRVTLLEGRHYVVYTAVQIHRGHPREHGAAQARSQNTR